MKRILIILFFKLMLIPILFSQNYIIVNNNNYYLNINQNAQNLAKNQAENFFVFSAPAQLGPSLQITQNVGDLISEIGLLGISRLSLTHGFMTRYGINDYVENQSKLNNIIIFLPYSGFGGYIITYENSFKYNIYKTESINLSFLHFIGLSFGGNMRPFDRFSMIDTSLYTGVKFIGGYKDFFYGFILSVKNNFSLLIFNSENEYMFPELGFGISVGGEATYKKIVARHGVTLGCSYYYHYKYYYEDYYKDYIKNDKIYDHYVNITLDYNFMFGWRWLKKSIKRDADLE